MPDSCGECGKPVARAPSSRAVIMCHACRQERRGRCSCGQLLPRGRDMSCYECQPYRPRSDGSPCGTWSAYKRHFRRGEKPCEACAEACRQQVRRDTCSRCGKPAQRAPTSARAIVCRECRRGGDGEGMILDLTCPECSAPFTRPRSQVARSETACCSMSCAMIRLGRKRREEIDPVTGAVRIRERDAASHASARARRLRHGMTWDGIGNEEILDRDGWRCQIPGCKRRPIRKNLKWPHPFSASVDHIVPMSLGGDDTATNKRASHLRCNIVRSNKGTQDQLALFGALREPPLLSAIGGPTAARRERPVKPPKPIPPCPSCKYEAGQHRPGCIRTWSTEHRRTVARQISEMRAQGHTWQRITDKFGFSGTGTAYTFMHQHIPAEDQQAA